MATPPTPHTPYANETTPVPWTPPPRPPHRDLSQLAISNSKPPRWYTDVYAFLLRVGWTRLMIFYAILFLSINAIFASFYLLMGPCIKGARPHLWSDAFFFSVQTLSTIGYGGMTPEGMAGNIIVTIESMVGLIGIALATGLVFAKFARPTAKVLFSRAAIISTYNGQPCLMFRLANQRGNNIVEASLRATILLDETTAEGHQMRRLHDLPVIRNFTPVFVLSWLVIHMIDEQSPLHGLSSEDIINKDARVIITLSGIDSVFSQTIHAYHMYLGEEIFSGYDFVDVIERIGQGRVVFHIDRFHDLLPRTSMTRPPTPTPTQAPTNRYPYDQKTLRTQEKD